MLKILARDLSWTATPRSCSSTYHFRHSSTCGRLHHYRFMSNFRVIEHTVKCQHTRHRPAAAELGRENDLRLHVKQYVPTSNAKASPGDVTIIGAHANGFPKELYEPFWDDLHDRLQAKGRPIRGIWIADLASQGQSGIINESILGPDPSWWDHGRDLMYLINQFQDEMPHPLIGIGHSVGGSQLAHLSLLHPRLLHSLILVDPIIQPDLLPHKAMAKLSTNRRDIWPSRTEAAKKFASSKFYQSWDSRVLEKWIHYGLRDLPTEQYPDASPQSTDVPVTLSTTVAQEVYFYLQPAYQEERLLQTDPGDLHQDIDPEEVDDFPFARAESQELFRRLPELKPSVLYVFGERSEVSPPENRKAKMERTGIGIGGSGGADKGRVKEVVLDCGHLVNLEQPTQSAEISASFINEELDRWDAEEAERRRRWEKLSRQERVGINDRWRKNLGFEQRGKRSREVSSSTPKL